MSAFLFMASIVSAGTTFTCTPTHVWDGDGPIWCAEGPKIRLKGIAAREVALRNGRVVDAGCKNGHPCPTRDGVIARTALVRLIGKDIGRAPTGHVRVRGAALRCSSEGSGKGSRTAAWCSGPKGDLSCIMVRSGNAVPWLGYDRRGKLCR
jgi:endonuclease YncB( thermonuclease family)